MEKLGKVVLSEGRVQFYHLPESIKIYIKVSPEEGARRIWKDLQNKETKEARNQKSVSSVEEMREANEEREATDAQRYLKLYGVDHRQESNYDFVVDTTKITAEQAADKVIEFIKKVKKA